MENWPAVILSLAPIPAVVVLFFSLFAIMLREERVAVADVQTAESSGEGDP